MVKTEVNSLAMQAGKVMFIWGEIANELKELDFDETYFECLKIAEDWLNGVDTDNFEEEGYIAPYAERVLMERFGI